MGWYGENSASKTHSVGLKKANAWGLYDMHGNVCEWCSDWHQDYNVHDVIDPVGAASGSCRVMRGGGWYNESFNCRSAVRDRADPAFASNYIGFRLARSFFPSAGINRVVE
jgi:formylglycine-generating enzyme required for sulfatase activity